MLLRCLDVLVRVVVQLLVNQFVDDLPQLYHAGDTGPLAVSDSSTCVITEFSR